MQTVKLISVFIIVQIITAKIFFLFIEKSSLQPIMIVELLLLSAFFIKALSFKLSKAFSTKMIFKLLTITSIALIPHLIIIKDKTTISWDGIALYDARAKYLKAGLSFSEIGKLNQFDLSDNRSYYLMYPPFTSIVHYFFNNINFPVKYYYSLMYILFICLFAYTLIKIKRSKMDFILVLLIALNTTIFRIGLLEYTNIVFSLIIFLAYLEIKNYLNEPRHDSSTLARFSILLAGSIWVRHIEPIWLIMIVSIVYAMVKVNRMYYWQKIIQIIKYSSLPLLSYITWSSFVGSNSVLVSVMNAGSKYKYWDVLFGIITGSFGNLTAELFSRWYVGLIPVLAIVIYVLSHSLQKNSNNNELLADIFTTSFLGLSIFFYVFGTYYAYISSPWWKESIDSVQRSASFLTPITVLFLYKMFHNIKKRSVLIK